MPAVARLVPCASPGEGSGGGCFAGGETDRLGNAVEEDVYRAGNQSVGCRYRQAYDFAEVFRLKRQADGFLFGKGYGRVHGNVDRCFYRR